MTSDRWEEINRVYDAALEVAEAERPAFVRDACQGDEDLRREVESLLAYDQQAQQFIDRSALQLTAEKLAAEPPSLVGRKLGPYQILGVLGAGGMGEVYRARDTRLNRSVAIKVLPRHQFERPDLRQRFQREARAIASLDHPHICALYDIGREGETDFLVMQYLKGETLSQRLKRGVLTTEETLRYSIEVAGALQTAHRKGVIHRDLKPGNIMLTEAGAKLLDFGLAKRQPALSPLAQTSSGFSGGQTATESKSLTEAGMILGTLEYMAPEQLENKEADVRTDIFALGVVIYEMATGRKAFKGDSKASLIAKILTFQPPAIKTIQPVSPLELDHVVQRCLAKKPEERWQTAAELTSELQEIAGTVLPRIKAGKTRENPSGEMQEAESKAKPALSVVIPEPPRISPRLIRTRIGRLSLIGVLSVMLVGFFLVWRMWQPERSAETPNALTFKPLTSFSSASGNAIESAAISPDGKYLALCSNGKLSIQTNNSGDKLPRDLPEGFKAIAVSWFPDGTKMLIERDQERHVQVKELDGANASLSSLWSIPLLGGTPQRLIDSGTHASVSPDGSLIAFEHVTFNPTAVELWLAAANGEQPRKIRAAPWPQKYSGPAWSPDGKRLAYLHDRGSAFEIESCDLQGTAISTIFSPKPDDLGVERIPWPIHGSNLAWTPDGRILFLAISQILAGHPQSEASIWQVKVDAVSGGPLGQPRRLTQWHGFNFVNSWNFSTTGDGRKLVLLRYTSQTDVYVAELQANHAMKNPKRMTLTESFDDAADWTPDGRAVLFSSTRSGTGDIFKQDIDQTEPDPLVASTEHESDPLLSPDGAWVLYLVAERLGKKATRLMRVPANGGPPELVLKGENLTNFSCAREANLCVVREEVGGNQVFSTFDPSKGKGEKLSFLTDLTPGTGLLSRLLSPQGLLIEKWKPSPNGLQIRTGSLREGPVQDFVFKKLVKECQFLGWSYDGKGIYLVETPSQEGVLYLGLDGTIQRLWNSKSGMGYGMDAGVIPSRDGRYIAYTAYTIECNPWILEGF